ncbi:hypothetical protein [Haploplasma axanthum]|nr:hypothetical protein [Haploplasma axanthum]
MITDFFMFIFSLPKKGWKILVKVGKGIKKGFQVLFVPKKKTKKRDVKKQSGKR